MQRLWIGLIIVPEAIPQRVNLTHKESTDTIVQRDAAEHSVISHPYLKVYLNPNQSSMLWTI